MRIQSWSKLLKRKPLAGIVVVFVIISAIVTVFRLSSRTRDEIIYSSSSQMRSTSPVELSWPLPLSQSKESIAIDTSFKRAPVGEEQIKKLKMIYPLLDTNGDSYVSIDELRNWIISKVKEHLQGALRENIFLFTAIDMNPRNGHVSWTEYHTWFLKKNGNNNTKTGDHDEMHPELERSIKEKIAWDKAAWSEAAKTDPDFLNLDEFLSFRHPESSHTTLLSKADDLLGEYDKDADETLTWEEYSLIPSESLLVRYSENKRQEEFNNFIDRNRDGKLDKREILSYLDPRNPRHAHLEAESLIQISDTNKDQQLSMKEILASADIFLASKVIDTETNFHDEF
ncbi:45 kDa calcium-binding protein-like [Daphnia pulex]|uniref:45 kDa calcium-binding protein-like n=1 Tax=Daphnia pulex TaxID=6669 RepID=UPI001EE06689|nr:45 kDa calcium-binding protein-like [Daphnia pulex]